MYLFSSKYSHNLPVSISESDYFGRYQPHYRYRMTGVATIPLFLGAFGRKAGQSTEVKYIFSYDSSNLTDFQNRTDHFYKQFAESVYQAAASTSSNISQSIITHVNDIFAEKKTIVEIMHDQSSITQDRIDVKIDILAKVFSEIGQNIVAQMDTTFKNEVVDQNDIDLRSENSSNFVSSLLGRANLGETVSAILQRDTDLQSHYTSRREALTEALSQAKFSTFIENTIKSVSKQLVQTTVANVSAQDVQVSVCVGQTAGSLAEILKRCSVINRVLNIIDQSDMFGVDSDTLNKFDTQASAKIEVKNEDEKVSSMFDSVGYVFIAVAALAGVVIVGYLIFKFVK